MNFKGIAFVIVIAIIVLYAKNQPYNPTATHCILEQEDKNWSFLSFYNKCNESINVVFCQKYTIGEIGKIFGFNTGEWGCKEEEVEPGRSFATIKWVNERSSDASHILSTSRYRTAACKTPYAPSFTDPTTFVCKSSSPPKVVERTPVSSNQHTGSTILPNDLWRHDWRTAPAEIVNAVTRLSPLDKTLPVLASDSIQYIPLRFAQSTSLVRVRSNKWETPNLFVYFLHSSGREIFRLDGAPGSLMAHAKTITLQINDQTATNYLWFFNFFTRGEEGPFLLVEDINDTFFPKGLARHADKYAEIKKHIFPAKCTANGDGYVCEAVVYYSNALFKGSFRLQKDGSVSMIDDIPVVADLPYKVHAPIRAADR